MDALAITDRIVVDPKILAGKPVVRGTRISVELVMERLAAGWNHTQILTSYPHLAEEDIGACVAYQKGRDQERKAALDRIAEDAFEAGLYDRTGIPEDGEDE